MIKNSSGISVDFFPLPFFYHFWMTFKIKPEERNKFPEVKQPSSPRPLSIAWIISLPAWWNLAKGHLLFLGSPLLFERLQTHTFLLVNLTCATEVGGKKKSRFGVKQTHKQQQKMTRISFWWREQKLCDTDSLALDTSSQGKESLNDDVLSFIWVFSGSGGSAFCLGPVAAPQMKRWTSVTSLKNWFTTKMTSLNPSTLREEK